MKVLNPEVYKHGISKPEQKFTFLSSINFPGGLIFFEHLGGGGVRWSATQPFLESSRNVPPRALRDDTKNGCVAG